MDPAHIVFHAKRHPAEMGATEVSRFLSSLAVDGKVSASTQNQALAALLFLYGPVLGVELPWLDDLVRAVRPERLPVGANKQANPRLEPTGAQPAHHGRASVDAGRSTPGR